MSFFSIHKSGLRSEGFAKRVRPPDTIGAGEESARRRHPIHVEQHDKIPIVVGVHHGA